MSPYRVLVEKETYKVSTGLSYSSERFILASMMSVDKRTQERRIFIVQKLIPITEETSYANIAHALTTSKNSGILDRYQIQRPPRSRKYSVYRLGDIGEPCREVARDIFIQSDCLIAAMEHYCLINDLKVLETL